ncbi:MAG TPA: hypothetical protein P5121_33540 [Caldilineaceae bacterium]|nr:hypothetical protein [Caldilineaceae bacterium]
MTVRYIRVNPVVDLFAPAVRAYGNIAIVGVASAGAANVPIAYTNPADAEDQLRDTAAKQAVMNHNADPVNNPPVFDLASSIRMAFNQSPGPTLVYGVPVAAGPDWDSALTATDALDVQFVVLANLPLDTANSAAIGTLASHVQSVSTTGADGMERMGVIMLTKGSIDTSVLSGSLANERLVYIAHKSDEDAAAAVAGTIAGYEPQVSLLLKQVSIDTDLFSAAEIDAINGSETFDSGPAGKGVNWLVDPVLIPGSGTYMGEGYTGNPGGKKYIDIVRTVDDVSFRLKAQMIKTIGNLRISRSGLRALIAQMEAVLEPLVSNEEIEGYDIVVPVLILLDKDPNTLTAAQLQQIQDAQSQRVVEVLVAVDYAGAIHRLAITLKFE